jgi:hypothetical protein
MNVGMLWFDNDPHTALFSKVRHAADYYLQKYGHFPNMCLVHPSMLGEHSGLVEGFCGKVAVRPNRVILPGHLWIGTEDKN